MSSIMSSFIAAAEQRNISCVQKNAVINRNNANKKGLIR